MVAYKTYSPQSLGFSPYQIASEIAKPFDYEGALKSLTAWNTLANQGAVTDFNQAQAEEKQRQNEREVQRNQAIQSQLDSGIDPNKIDLAEIEKSIGNLAGFSKIRTDQKEQAAKENKNNLDILKAAASIAKTDSGLANRVLDSNGLAAIYGAIKAPAQKSSKDGSSKPKASKPEMWFSLDGSSQRQVDANSPEDTSRANAEGFLPAKSYRDYRDIQDMGLANTPSQQNSEASPSMIESLYNKLVPNSTATPAPSNLPTPAPGQLLRRDRATGRVELVDKATGQIISTH